MWFIPCCRNSLLPNQGGFIYLQRTNVKMPREKFSFQNVTFNLSVAYLIKFRLLALNFKTCFCWLLLIGIIWIIKTIMCQKRPVPKDGIFKDHYQWMECTSNSGLRLTSHKYAQILCVYVKLIYFFQKQLFFFLIRTVSSIWHKPKYIFPLSLLQDC